MDHVTIQFPAIHNCTDNNKDLPHESSFRYVNVYQNHAVLVTPTTAICIDLLEYFINYCGIEETERPAFDELMAWMEGKSFTKDFWQFLVAKNEINVVSETKIKIKSGTFEKVLIYEHVNVSLDQVVGMLNKNIENQKSSVAAIGISQNNFNIISKTIGKMIGKNVLIFEFITITSTIRFTVDEMTFIFGVVLSSGQPTLKPFNFEHFKKFVQPKML